MATAKAQLDGFIAKYSPEVAKLGRAAIARRRSCSRSLSIRAGLVSLFFAKGVGLPDPHKRLKGSGNVVRHVVLTDIAVLDDPQIRELMQQALMRSGAALQAGKRGAVVIKMISARQRPRRPPTKTKARARS